MQAKVRNMVMSLWGVTAAEADVWILSLVSNVKEISLSVARISVIVLFLYCVIEHTAVGLLLAFLGYYLVSLELKVESLEKKVKGNKKDIRYDYDRGFDTSERDSVLQQLRER